jgi:hypothetical protein
MPGMTTIPPLGERIRGLVLVGLAVGLVRYALEFTASPYAMWFGVYYVMPIALVAVGLRGSWGPITWPKVLGSTALMCLFVWGIPNTLAYTTGQFLGWNHGRFHYGGEDDPATRAAPIAASALGKLGLGVLQGLLTTVGGTIWCTVWATLVIWLPARLRRRRAAVPS